MIKFHIVERSTRKPKVPIPHLSKMISGIHVPVK